MAAAGVANHLSLLASSPLSMACPGLTFCLPPPPPAPAPWLAREQVVGRNCRFLQGPGTDRAEVARLRAALQADPAQPVTVRLLNYRQDGSTFWNCLHVSPVYVHGLHALTHTHTHEWPSSDCTWPGTRSHTSLPHSQPRSVHTWLHTWKWPHGVHTWLHTWKWPQSAHPCMACVHNFTPCPPSACVCTHMHLRACVHAARLLLPATMLLPLSPPVAACLLPSLNCLDRLPAAIGGSGPSRKTAWPA